MKSRKRILFLAEGATMAHFVRPLVLAESLSPEDYEIHFYAPQRYSRFLQNRRFATGQLNSISADQFLENLAKGKPLFSTDNIRGYVAQDRDLMRTIRPDLVIGDLRLSLPISARLEKVPSAVVFNAYWSPYAKPRMVIPTLPITRILPPRWFGPMYRWTEPIVLKMHTREMNTVRRENGIPDLPPDLRVMYTDADYVLYADVPEFVPTFNRPENHRYIGTCPWTPPGSYPEWWDRMRADSRSKVFVSLGSSGPLEAMPALLKALSRMPVAAMISTSGRKLPGSPANVYQAELLPFTEASSESRVVVSHGGSGGLYAAIAAGTPVLGIPSNADQHLSTAVLEDNGVGLGIRVEDATEKRLADALERLLSDPSYRDSAQKWARIYERYDTPTLFRNFLNDVLG